MRALAAGLGTMLVALATWSAPCDWRWVNPAPPRADLHRVLYAHALFVAVGEHGEILTSSDGESWTPRPSGVTADLYGIEWAGGTWVAVGDGVILSSSNAVGWVVRLDDPTLELRDVEFGDSRFVAVGSGLGGRVLTSSNGVSWSEQGEGLDVGARSVTWTGAAFYACQGEAVYSTGADLEWRLVGEVPVEGAAYAGHCDLAWSGSRLLWVGAAAAFSSPDGETWEQELVVEEGCPQFASLRGAFASADVMIASGTTACPPLLEPEALLYVSRDGGDSWAIAWDEAGGGIEAFARSPGRLVAVGSRGDLLTSGDGVSWTCPDGGCTSGAWRDSLLAAVSTGAEVLVGGGVERWENAKRVGGGTLARSANGSAWQVTPLELERITGMAWNGSRVAAVGDGWGAGSDDAADWDASGVPGAPSLRAVAWGNGHFLAVGDGGKAVESPDGAAWSAAWVPHPVDLEDVAWGESGFVAVGRHGTILSVEHDPLAHLTLSANGEDLHGVAAGEGRYLAVGDGGTILASADGRGWSARVADVVGDLYDVAWSGQAYVAVGAIPGTGDPRAAAVLASRDGDHWTSLPVPGAELKAVAPLGTGFVAAGLERTLLWTPCLGPLLELDPQILRLSVGSSGHLTLTLDEALAQTTMATVTVSAPQVASASATLTVQAGAEEVDVPVDALALGGSWVRVALPAAAGGGDTSAWVEVHGSTWDPRRPAGRVAR